jgi:DNA (cytosine-5)-methyltransferase 1
MTLTFGSLFAGVGGADLGMEQAGFECVFQVEWDKHCQSILRRHWPDVPKWGDVCEVSGHDLPEADVIFFGSPCQDLSVAGKRAGLDGGRSSMFFEATRIIKEMRDATASRSTGPVPRAVIWENVPGALSSNNGEDFQAVLEALGDIGAVDIQWSVLDAQHFGVPQRRRRIFLVAIFDPATADRCDGPLLPVCEGRPRDFAKGRAKGEGATGGAEASPDGSGEGYRMLGFGHYTADDTASALKQRDYKDATDLAVIPFVKAKRAMSDTDDDRWEATETAPTLNAFDNGGESRATVLMPIPIHDQATRFAGRNGEKEGIGKGNGFGVGEPGDPMNTLTQADRHAVAQPIIFDGTRHDDFRMDTEIVPTLKQRMGTGGGQVPMVAEPVSASFKPGTMIRLGGGVWQDQVPTLRAEAKRGDNEPHIAQPIATTMAVRRLTPLECERLMGFPDDHTRWTDEGKEQADTHRYKQCGNAVASPVARWVGQHVRRVL